MKSPFRAAVFTGLVGISLLASVAGGGAQTITWVAGSGTNTVNVSNQANPTIGDGTHTFGTTGFGGSLYGTLSSAVTLGVGDSLSFSGTFTTTGNAGSTVNNSFRMGLFNSNGSADTTGWLGYWAGNSDDLGGYGFLIEKAPGNTADGLSSGGGSNIGASMASGSPQFAEGTYNFSLTYKRTASNTLQTIISLSNGSTYVLSNTINDTSVNTFTFDRVALTDNSAYSKLISFTGVGVTFTAAPEPGTTALVGAAGLGLACAALRRRSLAAAR